MTPNAYSDANRFGDSRPIFVGSCFGNSSSLMLRSRWRIYVHRRATGWRSFAAIEKVSTASGSTTNGGSASGGRMAMRTTLRLSITTEVHDGRTET